ncbi:hypothetical protein ACFLQJ_01865 [Calditrichota bacterium]
MKSQPEIDFKLLEYPLVPADSAVGSSEWINKLREARLKLESDKSGVVRAEIETIQISESKSKIKGAFQALPNSDNPHWQAKISRKESWELLKTGPIKASPNVKNSVFELRKNDEKIFGFRAAREEAKPDGIQGVRIFDDGWALEYAEFSTGIVNNEPGHTLNYRIVIDGKQLKDEKHYRSCYGYVRYNNKPFYFFHRGGKIGWNYAGKPHPQIWNAVAHNIDETMPLNNINYPPDGPEFFAIRDGMWYFTKLFVVAKTNDN